VTTDLTIITPCFNEEDSVQMCAQKVREVMARELPNVSYEHIFSDNASSDGTIEILREIAGGDKKVKVVVNSRNVGPFRIYTALCPNQAATQSFLCSQPTCRIQSK
jgi:glycosyltransferase involved in cell wall biosynthesis